MPTAALQIIIDEKTPAAQRNWIKALRGFVNDCLMPSIGLLKADAGIILTKMKKGGGIKTWSEDNIATYRDYYKPSTKERRALELLLNTGQPRAEIVRMGRRHIGRDGKLSMSRQKTGVGFTIPVLPSLKKELALMPKSEELTFLLTERGRAQFRDDV